MEKSQFVLLLFCSFNLNIETGIALRCYGCDYDLEMFKGNADISMAKDAPKCSDGGYGKEFDCSGSCVKAFIEGMGGEFFLNPKYNVCFYCFPPSNIVQRFCMTEKKSSRCDSVDLDGNELGRCFCNSDLCNSSPKSKVSIEIQNSY